jgi:Na+(H+)/acetate symporter ActP
LIVQVTITRTSSACDVPRLRHHQLTIHTPFFSLHYGNAPLPHMIVRAAMT